MFLNTLASILVLSIFLPVPSLQAQQITELNYLGRPHFRVRTATAVYLYDRAGGGFSSIRDREGLEWIGYKPGNGNVPESAAADFRGLPNLVFRGDDNGSGHPGFQNCSSELTGPYRIRTSSGSGLWEWQWSFTEDGAVMEVIKTDTTRAYWFLYEGTPGGCFDPANQFWGNSVDGHRCDAPPLGSDQTGHGFWVWAYFGHRDVRRCLCVMHLTPDHLTDYFSYMGNGPEGISSPDGMAVFGLGRDGATPLMRGPNSFRIGFQEFSGSGEVIPGILAELYEQLTHDPGPQAK